MLPLPRIAAVVAGSAPEPAPREYVHLDSNGHAVPPAARQPTNRRHRRPLPASAVPRGSTDADRPRALDRTGQFRNRHPGPTATRTVDEVEQRSGGRGSGRGGWATSPERQRIEVHGSIDSGWPGPRAECIRSSARPSLHRTVSARDATTARADLAVVRHHFKGLAPHAETSTRDVAPAHRRSLC